MVVNKSQTKKILKSTKVKHKNFSSQQKSNQVFIKLTETKISGGFINGSGNSTFIVKVSYQTGNTVSFLMLDLAKNNYFFCTLVFFTWSFSTANDNVRIWSTFSIRSWQFSPLVQMRSKLVFFQNWFGKSSASSKGFGRSQVDAGYVNMGNEWALLEIEVTDSLRLVNIWEDISGKQDPFRVILGVEFRSLVWINGNAHGYVYLDTAICNSRLWHQRVFIKIDKHIRNLTLVFRQRHSNIFKALIEIGTSILVNVSQTENK